MVSVIIPVYNVEKYLRECVDSVLSQSYTDFEIILVDDGSTDNSGIICEEYKSKKVKVIHKQNQGLGMARNSGLEIATGEYVAFLDSDDYWGYNVLNELMSEIEKSGADTCIGGYIRITNEGETVLEEYPNANIYSTNREIREEFFPRLMGSAPDNKDAFRPSVWNAIYSMSIIRKYNLKFPSERVLIAEDIIFDLDYYIHAQKVVLVPISSYYYRITPGSLTQKYKADRFEKVVFLYKTLFERLDDYGYDERCRIRAARQFFVYVRSCIKQENVNISKLRFSQALININKICSSPFTQECINNYPIIKLGWIHKIFLMLVKNKASILLYFALCCQKKGRGGRA